MWVRRSNIGWGRTALFFSMVEILRHMIFISKKKTGHYLATPSTKKFLKWTELPAFYTKEILRRVLGYKVNAIAAVFISERKKRHRKVTSLIQSENADRSGLPNAMLSNADRLDPELEYFLFVRRLAFLNFVPSWSRSFRRAWTVDLDIFIPYFVCNFRNINFNHVFIFIL